MTQLAKDEDLFVAVKYSEDAPIRDFNSYPTFYAPTRDYNSYPTFDPKPYNAMSLSRYISPYSEYQYNGPYSFYDLNDTCPAYGTY